MRQMCATSIVIENAEITLYFGDELYHVDSVLPSFPHMHPVHEIFVLRSGEVLFEGNFGQRRIRGSDVCIMPPFTLHSTITQQSSSAMTLMFTYQKIAVSCAFDFHACLSKLSARQVEPIICRNNSLIVSNLFDAVSQLKTGELSGLEEIKTKNVLSLLFIGLSERLPFPQPQPKERYAKGKDYYLSLVRMDMLLAACSIPGRRFDVDMAALSQQMSFSLRQIQNVFGSEYQMSIKRYVYLLKMEFAAFALRHFPQISIAQLSVFCSYSCPGVFSAMFAKYHGVSAGEYRKTNQGDDWSRLEVYHQLYDRRQLKEEEP